MTRIRSKYGFHCIFIIQNRSFFYKCLYRSRKTAAMHTAYALIRKRPFTHCQRNGNRLTDRIMTDIYILQIFIRRIARLFYQF